MPNNNNSPFDERRLRRAAWLGLVSLAWLQLTLASHQFDHVAYLADTCHVCVQLDRIDDAAVDQSEPLPGPFGRHVETLRPTPAVASTVSFRHFDSRAPPAT